MSWLSVAWDTYKANREALTPLGALVGGVIVAWKALHEVRTARERHLDQSKADRERRITENFSKAVEQLGSDQLPTRLGGIYSLERISRESERDYWPIMETLTAFVREGRPSTSAPISSAVEMVTKAEPSQKRGPPTDIQAVLDVLGRREKKVRKQDKDCLHLEGADLRGANLISGHFEGANFNKANLAGAYLKHTNLKDAFLWDAKLNGAILVSTQLKGATGLTQGQVDEALGDEGTVLPKGLYMPAHWSKPLKEQRIELSKLRPAEEEP